MTTTSTKDEGLAAPTTNPQTTTHESNFTDNSTLNQRLKLLDWLFEHGSITTAQAREKLDVMSPAPRIMELKRDGYLIVTLITSWTSVYGIKHRIGRYVLTQNEPVESGV